MTLTSANYGYAKLNIEPKCSFSNHDLGQFLAKALRALDETGCAAMAAPETGVAMSTTALQATLERVPHRDGQSLRVTLASDGLSAQVLQAKLAGLVGSLLRDIPATRVIWLDNTVGLPSEAFLEALEPQECQTPLVAPRRVARPATAAPRPGPQQHRAALARLKPSAPTDRSDTDIEVDQAQLRASLLREADTAELDACSSPLPVEARLTTWAMSLTVATFSLPIAAPVMIYNLARGEDVRLASLSMGLAGLFVALDTSGAMAGVLNAF